MYKSVIRPILFLFDPESIHYFIMNLFNWLVRIPGIKFLLNRSFQLQHPKLEKMIWGLNFSNPVGLAAGFDKDGRWIEVLSHMGFGFIEIGTLTPKPQQGNPKPRIFRLPKDHSMVNRLGFNNQGVQSAVQRIRSSRSSIIIGGNIGKNKSTPNQDALNDYKICFEELYPWVDYFVVNVSSPNTPNLRQLQEKEPLKALLAGLQQLNHSKDSPKPLLLKIAPDLNLQQLNDVIEIVKETNIDGVIATNTTIARENLSTDSDDLEKIGQGGLSGQALKERSTQVIRTLRQGLGESVPIIGVGGISSAQDAMEKMDAGATLVQIYTGFIYQGPSLIRNINKALLAKPKEN
ncbi:MAG: quinone-dependent dihydroorotate dehydrogenase [Bacteroidetes bacterium]|nr:quinone-dependent dihydroorotate dehydrogenase [Bacteroidota bacterium]